MGAFDNEIKMAKKIGQDWIETSEGYQAQFILIKKANLKWEKDAITELQNEVKAGKHLLPNSPRNYSGELEVIQERLSEFRKEGERLFGEHEKWSLAEPRRNMGFIGEKLKLGDVKSEKYKAVSEALKSQLTTVANTIKATQKAWNEDVKYTMDIQQQRLDALKKVVDQGESASSSFIAQIKRESKMFIDMCEKAWTGISGKLASHAKDLPAAQEGKLASEDKTKLQQQFQIYQSRVPEIAKLIEIIEKNHRRVIKSVPPAFINGFFSSEEKKAMEKKKEEVQTRLKQAAKLYEKLIEAFQKNKLV